MLFAVFCVDKPGAAGIRAANRAAHLDYLKSFGDAVRLGGPTLTPDGQGMTGSLLVLDLPDAEAAERFVANDPYGKAGLFESVIVRPFRQVLPPATQGA